MSWPHLMWRWGISFGTMSARDPLSPIDNAKVATVIALVTSRPFFNYGIHAPISFLWEHSAQWRYRQAWTMKQAARTVGTKYLKPAGQWAARYTAAVTAGVVLGSVTGLVLRETGFFGEEGSESFTAASNFYMGRVGPQEWLSTITEGFIAPMTKR